LDTYYNPDLEIDKSMTPEVRDKIEIDRCLADWSRAALAAAIPRRVENGTREELALDKKRSRRMQHVAAQCIGMWGGDIPTEPDDALAKEGAQVLWVPWWEERDALLLTRMTYAATWAKKTNQLQYGKSALQHFINERDWYRYAIRS
jgi:hypothetical protein